MSLIELPEEILIVIIRRLDLHSKVNLYYVCTYLKQLVTFHGGLKKVDVSRSTLATVTTLKQCFFKDISLQIEDLSLHTVPNLTKSVLLAAAKRLTNLKFLNVSYTSITIPDVVEIIQFTPALKGVAVNFLFGNANRCRLSPKTLQQCKTVFSNLKNVEFVGSPSNILYSQLPFYILQDAALDFLKLTIIRCQHVTYQNVSVEKDLNCRALGIFVTHWKEANIYYGKLAEIPTLRKLLDLKKYECLLIKCVKFGISKVYLSSVFQGVLNRNFHVDEEDLANIDQLEISGNVAIHLWAREKHSFDEKFISHVVKKINCYFPYCINNSEVILPSENWFLLTVTSNSLNANKSHNKWDEPALKKKRIATQNHTLDFEGLFNQISEVELTLNLQVPWQPVSLSNRLNYLGKLTYLSLVGPFVHYNVDFFQVLFVCSNKLHTLNVEASTVSQCSSFLSKNIKLSRSLRNLRLVDRRIDHKLLFQGLSDNMLLENVHIVDEGTEAVNLGDITGIVVNSPNLYNLFIQVAMSNSAKLKALRALNKAKNSLNRSYLNIELHTGCGYKGFSYDPFMEVFKINPIKPI